MPVRIRGCVPGTSEGKEDGETVITTLTVLAMVCLLSFLYVLLIPYFASTRAFMHFLPQEIREAAKNHRDPPAGRRLVGALLTAAAVAGYLGAWIFLARDGCRRGYGFWLLFGRFMLFMYGYKLYDILVQDQYLVITKKYFVRFFPETANCRSWDDRSFNTRNQLIRMALFPVICAFLAWLTWRIGR
ncbi:MAG: hypothetical protein IJ088_09725 [Clostridia bacterium]|nr:hypothetical protein [Clostridia bacterium]